MTMANVQRGRPNGCGCGASTQAVFASGLALVDPPPLLAQAVESCMQGVTRLQGTVASEDNPARRSRDLAFRETGVDVDANPYRGITRDKIEAVLRAAFHARLTPEVLLAKWTNEGAAAMTLLAEPVTPATTAANARTLLRSSIHHRHLGMSGLTVTNRPSPRAGIVLDETDAGAAEQERSFAAGVAELVRGHFLDEDITGAINGQLAVTSSGGTFSVRPSVPFYALSLILLDAVLARLVATSFPERTSASEELRYLLWNMGEASFRPFLDCAEARRREAPFPANGEPMAIERWALHTRPKQNEHGRLRAHAIRFAHLVGSYRPVFQDALRSINPAIDDLRKASVHTAAFQDDPLGIGAAPRPMERPVTSRAMAGTVAGGGHGAFRHAPLGGPAGDNVELRWNVPAGTPANATIDIVVHLHGYGDDGPHFLADKTTMAGVALADASGNATVRVNRPTLALVPRGRRVRGSSTWLFDNLPDAPAFNALVSAGLAWLTSNALHLPSGATLRDGRCTLMAHSGGGAGLSVLLAAGVDPDEVVCFDSIYVGEAAIRRWALARLGSPRAASSALRVYYTGCSAPSSAHPAGEWTWDSHRARWVYGGTGSWSWRGGAWHLVTTEVSSRQLGEALETALAPLAHAASLRPRFRVERTSVAHRDLPARYTPGLLDDIAVSFPTAFAPPASAVRPACCANPNWLTSAPAKPGGKDPPPARPTAPPTAQAYGHGTNGKGNGASSYGLATRAARVIAVDGFASIAATALEAPFTAPTKTWSEVMVLSRIGFDEIEPASYAEWRRAGFARDRGVDGFEVRIRGRLVVPGDLARRTENVPFVVLCMGNHNTFDSHGEIPSFEGYDYLQQSLAASGYASLSVDTNPANEINAGIRMRADMILATVKELQDHGEAAVVGKIDFANVALVGHSRGGEAVVYASKLNRAAPNPLGIRGVVSISPTDLSRGCSASERFIVSPASAPSARPLAIGPLPLGTPVPLALTAADGVRYFVIYGSHDGDVSGDGDDIRSPVSATSVRDGTGFSLYDRATCDKTMIFPRGITHNRFNTHWDNCADYADPRHSFVVANCTLRNQAEPFNVLIFAAAKHRELANFYVGAFVDRVLKGDASKEDVLRGKRALPPHTIAFQFLPADRLDVSLAGASPRVDTFTVVHCPHDANVFQGAPGARVRVGLASVDLRAQRRSTLTMRVGAQYAVPSQVTIAGERKPVFTVRIDTRAGTSVATDNDLDRAGSLEPDRPFFHQVSDLARNVTKLQLDTVVLPLSAFRPPLDPTDVRSVEIEIGSGGTSPVFIDSVAFV